MLPALADLQAFRLWQIEEELLFAMDRRGSLAPLPEKEFEEAFALRRRGTPDFFFVLRLIQAYLPGSHHPALDHLWETKGRNATRADLLAYWEIERARPTQQTTVNNPTVVEMLALLREIKSLLSELRALRQPTSNLGSTYASDFSTQLAGSRIDEGETSTLRSLAEQILDITKAQ